MLDLAKQIAAWGPTAFTTIAMLGLCGLQAYVVYLLAAKSGPVKQISSNHLHGLPEMVAALERIEHTLGEIRDGINYLKGVLDRRLP